MHRINLDPFFNELKPVASIFDELLNDGLSSVLGAGIVNWTPKSNIIATEKSYTIEVAAPGLKKSDFKLNLENDKLSVTAKVSTDTKAEKVKAYTRKEFSSSSFTKAFHIPENTDLANISATYTDGILCIDLPKVHADEQATSKTIEIL